MKTRTVLSFAAASAVLAAAPRVRAEAAVPAPACYLAAAPDLDANVPANVLALVLTQAGGTGAVASNIVPQLTGPSPAALTVAADSRAQGATLLLLQGPLAPSSSYRLDYSLDCNLQGGGPASIPHPSGTATFATIADVALPTTQGTMAVDSAPAADRSTGLTLTMSPELEAYLPVTLFDISVDGTPWAQLGYGYVEKSGGVAKIGINGGGAWGKISRSAAGAVPLCSASDDAVKVTHVELRAHVAGATIDPAPLAFDVPIDCTQGTPIGISPEAGVPDAGSDAAGPDAAGPSDAGPDDPGATSSARVGGHGGCALEPGGDPSSLSMVLGAAVAAIASGLRRRRRR